MVRRIAHGNPMGQQLWSLLYVVRLDPTTTEPEPHLVNYDDAEGDAEEDEGGDVDRLEEAAKERAASYRGWFANLARRRRLCRLSLNSIPPHAVREGVGALILPHGSRTSLERVLAPASPERILGIFRD